jgi:formylglycine-generating enzyme required for sulfatase activity
MARLSFLASAYCYDKETHRALQRHEAGEAVVIPVILRPADWERAPFGKLQALPRDARPVTKWRNRDEALKTVITGIAEVAERLSKSGRSGIEITSSNLASSQLQGGRAADERVEDSDARIAAVLKEMRFIFMRPGEFLMGAEDGEAHERPPHKVVLGKSFYIGAYTVTQREWRAAMGTEPWAGRDLVERGERFPAVYVNWEDAKAFLAKLNAADSNNYYRLPTEEEWEFAARAGTTSRFSFGDDETAFNAYGWYKQSAYDAGVHHPLQVGTKRPNPWGLFDMHGNVWEWVEDWYYGPYSEERRGNPDEKVLRGGGFDFGAFGARSAFRNKLSPIRSNHVIGFRIVKEPL